MKIRFPAALSLRKTPHDSKLHEHQGSAAPECSQIRAIGVSKMDPNDPVSMAMHKKRPTRIRHDGVQDNGMKDMPVMRKRCSPTTYEGEKKWPHDAI